MRPRPASGIHGIMTSHLRQSTRARTFAVAALLALAASGCDDRSFLWVGPVFDSDAVAAISLEDGALRAYVCGGPETFSTVTRWYDGRVGDGQSFEATSDDGDLMQGYVEETYAYAWINGENGGLSAEMFAPEGELAGLYSVEDSGCRTGVIVWGDGSEPSLQGTWCDDQGRFAQVTPVYPIQLEDRGIHVQVDLTAIGQGVRDLYVTRDLAR